jgi:hypothetical protein
MGYGEILSSKRARARCTYRQLDGVNNLRHLCEHAIDGQPMHFPACYRHVFGHLLLFFLDCDVLALFVLFELFQ